MSEAKEKYGFVYIWYDRKHKRYYIGSHWGTEDDGYICSSRMMRQAYNRRPKDFKRRIISRVYTNRKDLLNEENKWLSMVNPLKATKSGNKNPKYYNICLNAGDFWWSDETEKLTVAEKISRKNKGNPKLQIPCSEEKKAKISQANSGKKRTKEQRETISKAFKGRIQSEETKRKKAESLKKHWKEAKKNGTRPTKQPKPKGMSIQEQGKLSSNRLKELWADPVWREKQRQRLSEGAKKRPPRSEESKQKARLAQLGIPKPKKKSNFINTA